MPDDRDRRRIITPPKGVRAQTADPVSWEDEHTPVEATPIVQLAWRSKRHSERLKALGEHVGDLRETSGKIEGKLDILVESWRQDREERKQSQMMRLTAFQAEVEVDKTAKLAEIAIEKTDKISRVKLRSQVVTKIVALAGPPLAALLAYAVARC